VASNSGPGSIRGSDVPQDKAWVFGVLPNGLRYAVRHNGVPPGQMSVRMRIDAGSLYETDPQRGYAHLIEHLTFRDSKYLEAGEAIPARRRLGATFGQRHRCRDEPDPDRLQARHSRIFRLPS
jgi:zinc protease